VVVNRADELSWMKRGLGGWRRRIRENDIPILIPPFIDLTGYDRGGP